MSSAFKWMWQPASLALLLAAAHLTACSTTPPKSLEQAQEDEATAARLYAALNADPTYYFRHVNVRVTTVSHN